MPLETSDLHGRGGRRGAMAVRRWLRVVARHARPSSVTWNARLKAGLRTGEALVCSPGFSRVFDRRWHRLVPRRIWE